MEKTTTVLERTNPKRGPEMRTPIQSARANDYSSGVRKQNPYDYDQRNLRRPRKSSKTDEEVFEV
jgi:hypothetical protein